MTLDVLLTGIGAILTAAMGVLLVLRELRRRDRIAASRQIDELAYSLTVTRQDVIAYQQWAYHASQLMVANGVIPPAMPPINPAAPEEDPKEERQESRRERRKTRRAQRKADRTVADAPQTEQTVQLDEQGAHDQGDAARWQE